mmetsp:Transcript_17212/g.32385  ORF Transcript_17212/g.32385 Transcript_17212/m.32385 type:complete len:101 (+) Transcript_17212:371-673(+)
MPPRLLCRMCGPMVEAMRAVSYVPTGSPAEPRELASQRFSGCDANLSSSSRPQRHSQWGTSAGSQLGDEKQGGMGAHPQRAPESRLHRGQKTWRYAIQAK